MTIYTLVLRYALFSVLAIVANLVTQRGVLGFGESGFLFILAMVAGTAVSLVLKYVLDKRWIFGDISTGVTAHSKKFSRYTAMGLVTTALFWGIETAFWLVWQTDAMREVGAILGLSFGYFVKYKLDRRFVFSNQEVADSK